MRLRARLALTTVALAVPLAVGLAWIERQFRSQRAGEWLSAHALARVEGDGRRACEREPASWAGASHGPERRGPGRGPPPIEVFPYDEALRPSAPSAPPLPAALRDQIAAGAAMARGTFPEAGRTWDQALARTAWGTGPCAFVLARIQQQPFFSGPLLFHARGWVIPLLALIVAAVLGLGPLVRRIRLLAERVRVSARHRYTDPIALPGNDEIAELAAAFDEAAREVRGHLEAQEQREQALRDWLANTTHDVMTPLTVLQGHLATIRQNVAEGRPIAPEVVAGALDEAHYMASLVHNLGVAARLDAGEPYIVRTPVDLAQLVERVVSRHRPVARQHQVEIDYAVPEEPPRIPGDETFLEQAVSNVVYNAIRYNNAGGHVAVLLERRSGERFRLRVVDDGPGIPDAELPFVLERHLRGEQARTRHADGRGLGLSITRRVAELHGLTLTLGPSEYGGLQVDFEGPG